MTAWKQIGRDMSPIYHVTAAMPPALIFHGGGGYADAAGAVRVVHGPRPRGGCTVKLVVRPARCTGGLRCSGISAHFADWFDRYLEAH